MPLVSFLLLLFLSPVQPSVFASGDSPRFSNLPEIRRYYGVPGLGVSYLRGAPEERVIHSEVTGKRRSGSPQKLAPEDAFYLGTFTKSMTALLVAMAVSEKKFGYRSTLRDLFPGDEIDPSLESVTIEHLLLHTSGIGGDSVLLEIPDEDLVREIFSGRMEETEARKTLVREILKVPAQTDPGSDFEYSNPGYVLLGRALEQVYGKSFRALIQQRIFRPLGMGSCGFGPAPVVSGHNVRGNRFVPKRGADPAVYSPAGDVHCSLEDLMKYAGLHIDLYQRRSAILSPEVVKALYGAVNYEGHTLGGWITKETGADRILYLEGGNSTNQAALLIQPGIEQAFGAVSNAGGSAGQESTRAAIK